MNKISVISISFNQVEFLRECIESVLGQQGVDLEYIVVDPGSKDGSREVIDSYGHRLKKIYERDQGPADGLNKGFAIASGDILCYLNSDDCFEPDALIRVINLFKDNPNVDVIYGHGWIIDQNGEKRRRCHSDRFSLSAAANGTAVVIQPSTFFRRSIFEKSNGFNLENRSNWDGELIIDFAILGAKFLRVNEFFSNYRVHGAGITGSGRLAQLHLQYEQRMFMKITGRERTKSDELMSKLFRIYKHLSHPFSTLERLKKGSIFASTAKISHD